jgi:hypothetical protein
MILSSLDPVVERKERRRKPAYTFSMIIYSALTGLAASTSHAMIDGTGTDV